ncbi:hypothetical protein [Fluviispira vulneris]|uniref:hypothetical protein n=1 Tax=Fluviispira vulneris TaxID=2763012 RepID=UPI0016447B7F|nr:hypothetical protein [Fluviispira vulneris]
MHSDRDSNLSIFERVLMSQDFNTQGNYKKILYHYETLTFNQVKHLLTESEIFNLNVISEKIFLISSEFDYKSDLKGLRFDFNKVKNFLELRPNFLDSEFKRENDNEYEYNYIILKNDPALRINQIRDAIIETIIDYELKINIEKLEVRKYAC